MYQRRRARVLLTILVLVSLVLITIDFRSGEDGPLSRIRGLATTVFGPVQDGLAALVRPIGDAVGSVGDLFDLRDENERLQARLDELEERRRSFEDLERENAELRALLEMRDRAEFEVVPATTVSQGPSNYEWTVTINVGSNAGVERDMAVINGDGLVGKVILVRPDVSRVLLAIDPTFGASARIARNAEQGPVSGQGGDPLRFQPWDPEADIRVGDEIVTSSYSNGVFPAGIPIGSVEDVGTTTTLLNRDVLVRPYVDFTRLSHVLVVLTEPVPEPPPVDDTSDDPFVPPVVPSPLPSPAPTPSPSPDGTET